MAVLGINKHILQKVLAVLFVCTSIFLITSKGSSSGIMRILSLNSLQQSLHKISDPGLKELQGKELPIVHPHSCIRTQAISPQQISYIMCVKPNDYISNLILNDGIFERQEVELMISLLADYSNSTFLDLGANLGTFSVAAAAFKHRVVSVDPFIMNHAYSRLSTLLQGSEDYVRYIVNTVSNGTEVLYPWYRTAGNEGATSFITYETAVKKPSTEVGSPVYPVQLQDILDTIPTDTVIIKIDIEGHECRALVPYLTKKNKTKYIPYIMIEWVFISHNTDGYCPEVGILVQAFVDSGYYAVNVYDLSKRANNSEEKSWNNMLWVHQHAAKQF
ncbi:uncharacterized protein LOC111698037 isoform X2 [Eurytemora carolleeae]|uniref:uncharacterized protein LOC111698037 isoform X2 n=1 Tax=Eurytemora carolleeae TaxID=1294199 RepID=UPI000C7755A8|nr:uncharacterized protein LOC111698037 isoform X2 [Eurytemora carolleeae]|eukprot:XP_023324026.1 uncharacterized protein LOC111698037 isoform X2 [Eurytemora affinis]